MFTGLIQEIGRIISITNTGGGKRIKINQESLNVTVGESVAIKGVCLTVCGVNSKDFEAYVSRETLNKTNLSKLTPGDKVNLEPALRLSDRLGGHLVQGHIDGISKVIIRKMVGDSVILTISPSKELLNYLVPKGSVAIDGVSLTVATIKNNCFTVTIIPYTRDSTTLGDLRAGNFVNLEVDIIGKYLRCQNLTP
ncbi:riboflavin synthase [candidate division WOR-3 bacterium]|nr:riboflavin synthase [candidate division WOR-3 bacterium]